MPREWMRPMATWLALGGIAGGSHLETTGFLDLQGRYGTNLATGSGITVAQVEASELTNYLANTNNFPGKTFAALSGPSGFSSHATTVGTYLYGGNSVASGTTNIRAYQADGFLNSDCLRYGTTDAPLNPSPARVMNHSWIGGDTNPPTSAAENDILQRLDHIADSFGVTIIAGVNNGDGSLDYPLLSQGYNAIAVGASGGPSRSGPAFAPVPGRAKPDIVAPTDLTSWAAALVAGAASLLTDRALSQTALTNAADPRVIKALLLNTAAKVPGWHKGSTNGLDDAAVPLDWRSGAGDLRINHAYDLLNSGEATPHVAGTNAAWDLGTTAAGKTNWYFFSLDPASHQSLKATLVWHRHVQYQKTGPFLTTTTLFTNLDLMLFSASGTNPLSPLAVSTSAIDNVEHLWITNFSAGTYALGVTGPSPESYGLAFDAVTVPLVSIIGTDTNAAETGPGQASFLIRRAGPAELPVTVNLATSGTASNGLDYAIAPSVTLTAGQTSASVTLNPIPDNLAEGSENATVAIAGGSGYAISPTNQAFALIADRPFDQWRFENFTAEELADRSISGEGADPDGDGPNLVEYDSGGNPRRFEGGIAGPGSILVAGGTRYLSLSFQRRPPPSDVTNIVELSSNLTHWTPGAIQVGAPIPGTNGTETVTFRDTVPTSGADRRFIRRRVEWLPAP